MVIAHDIRLRAVLALARDAVLSARARLARGAVGVWSDNVITFLTFKTELRVRRARAVDAAIHVLVRRFPR